MIFVLHIISNLVCYVLDRLNRKQFPCVYGLTRFGDELFTDYFSFSIFVLDDAAKAEISILLQIIMILLLKPCWFEVAFIILSGYRTGKPPKASVQPLK